MFAGVFVCVCVSVCDTDSLSNSRTVCLSISLFLFVIVFILTQLLCLLYDVLQEDSNIRWFRLKEGQLAYDPVTQNYFALMQVPDCDVDEAVAEAEKAF